MQSISERRKQSIFQVTMEPVDAICLCAEAQDKTTWPVLKTGAAVQTNTELCVSMY